MSRSSARRAQVSPTAALVALLAVGAGLSLYAGVLDASVRSGETSDTPVPIVADRTLDRLAPAGVATPARLRRFDSRSNRSRVAPDGYRVNVTLAAGGERWRAGPPIPTTARTARAVRTPAVRLAPGRVVPGRLRVVIWS